MGLFTKRAEGAEITKGYYFLQLPDSLKAGYEAVALGIQSFKKLVSVPGAADKEDIKKIMDAVVYDNPIFCYMDPTQFQVISRGSFTVVIDYVYDKRKALQVVREINEKADWILSQIVTDDMDDYQKCLAVHDYLTANIRYHFSAAHVKTIYDAHTPEGALLKHQAVCGGIAKAMLLMLQKLGVFSLVVLGESEINREHVGHAWNIVRLDKDYYHIDVTWDLQEINHFAKRSHIYMNLDDDSMIMNHVWELQDYPSCSSRAENYYVRKKHYFRSMRSFELYIQKCLDEREAHIDIRFEDTLNIPEDGGEMLAEKIVKVANTVGSSIRLAYAYYAEAWVFQANIEYL